MQIHELTNTADLSSTDYVGVDNGTTTRRFDLGALIASIRNRLTNTETGITNLQTSVSDVQGDVADAQSDITGLGTRLDAAESSITSQGNRLTTAESDIDNLETKMTTAESNIATLQSTKVDMTTPLLNFDDTATDPLTDDGALANALTALGILGDVIPSGGGMLYLKKALAELSNQMSTIPFPKKRSGTWGTSFTGVGSQIDANRIMVWIQFPFICEGNNYTFTPNSGTILGIRNVTASEITVDNKQSHGVRIVISNSGTVRDSYICSISGTIAFS